MYGNGAWSPDGTRLAHADGSPTNPFLVISGADLGEQLRLRLPVGTDPGFSWSPDGRRIAFNTQTDTTAQVFVIDVAAGASAVPVTDEALHAIRPSWSPDGAWIAFRGGVGLDQEALYVVHPDGSDVRRLSQEARAVNPWCGFPWTPDGRSILFETAYNGVWLIDADGSHERIAVGGEEQAYCPSMAPDGKRIAAVVDAGYGKKITIIALDGSSRVVPPSPGFYWPGAIWSADAKKIVTMTGDAHARQGPIAIFDAAGAEPPQLIPITDGTIVDWQRLPS
jgi:Tol biopolymer transport system component